MNRSIRRSIMHGAIAGLVAGAVVAAWFLAVDVASASPLSTPEELGRVFLGDAAGSSLARILAYTVVHFGAFALLGVLGALALNGTGMTPGWLAGSAFGVIVLTVAHYGSLLATGSDALTVLPWPHVLAANLAAGLAWGSYLHGATAAERPMGFRAWLEHPLLVRGVVAGLVGAAAVAGWFFLLDLAAGRPLFTPAALGSAVFLGAEGPAEVRVGAGTVAAYTCLHVAAFAAAGVVFVAAARQLERVPSLAYLAVLAGIVLEAVSFGVLVALGSWIVDDLSVWAIGVGNLLAVLSMGTWIWRSRPALRRRVVREGFTSAA